MDTTSQDPGLGSQLPGISKSADGGPANPFQYDPSWLHSLAAVGLGLPMGFLGVKSLYDNYQDSQYDKRTEEAKKQYIHQLGLAQVMNKQSEETPKVDMLCQAMADELEKNAGLVESLKDLGQGVLGKAKAGIDGAKNLPWKRIGQGTVGAGGLAGLGALEAHVHSIGKIPNYPSGPLVGEPIQLPSDPDSLRQADAAVNANSIQGIKNVANYATGNTPEAVKNMLTALFSVSGVGMLGMLLNNHQNRKEREQKATYPTSIEYAG
jgi:hypothetical protein